MKLFWNLVQIVRCPCDMQEHVVAEVPSRIWAQACVELLLSCLLVLSHRAMARFSQPSQRHHVNPNVSRQYSSVLDFLVPHGLTFHIVNKQNLNGNMCENMFTSLWKQSCTSINAVTRAKLHSHRHSSRIQQTVYDYKAPIALNVTMRQIRRKSNKDNELQLWNQQQLVQQQNMKLPPRQLHIFLQAWSRP